MELLSELISLEKAFFVSVAILSFGLIISSIEDLMNWELFKSSGILSWKVARLTYHWGSKGIRSWVANLFLNDKSFKYSLWLKLFSSALLFILACLGHISPTLLLLQFLLLTFFSFRSPYGLDGAYQISLVILFPLFIASVAGLGSATSVVCFWFIAGQLILSYFIAGSRKLLSSTWRNGNAIKHVFSTEVYGNAFIYKLVQNSKTLAIAMCWAVILYESLFFMVIFADLKWALVILAGGVFFHFSNAVFMGLNNFLFSFVAAYPILLYCILTESFRNQFCALMLYVLIPLSLIVWIWNSREKNTKIWILQRVFVGIYVIDLFLTGFWPFFCFGFFVRYFLIAAFIVALLRPLFKKLSAENSEVVEPKKESLIRTGFKYLLYGAISILLFWEATAAFSGSKTPQDSVELDFPLKNGTYYVVQGGDSEVINHHCVVKAQRYALDILKLNKAGFRAKKLFPVDLDDYNIFSDNIYSPCSGVVIRANNGSIDHLPNDDMEPANPAGNYVAIQRSGTNQVVILAHLLKGSLIVKEGDFLENGQLLAKVGNSGHTSEPHLHIHCIVMDADEDFLYQAEPIPITFQNSFLTRNSTFHSQL